MPAVLACTSGTAAANYAPAVIEAYEARVPLIVLTADRPPELRDVGAGQTIDQVKLYGRAAKWFLEVDEAPADRGADALPAPPRLPRGVDGDRAAAPAPCTSTSRCASRSSSTTTLPRAEPGGGGRKRRPRRGSSSTRPRAAAPPTSQLAGPLPGARRRPLETRADGDARRRLRRRATAGRCWPTRCRAPAAARPRSPTTTRCCASREWGEGFAPDLVVRVGDLPTSKPLRALAGRPRTASARSRSIPTAPGRTPTRAVDGDPPRRAGGAARRAARRHAGSTAGAPPTASPAARSGRVLGGALSEPAVAVRTAAALGPQDTLVVASSMPVRDLETFAVTGARVLSNRGANGIDGTASTALGVAAATARPHRPAHRRRRAAARPRRPARRPPHRTPT